MPNHTDRVPWFSVENARFLIPSRSYCRKINRLLKEFFMFNVIGIETAKEVRWRSLKKSLNFFWAARRKRSCKKLDKKCAEYKQNKQNCKKINNFPISYGLTELIRFAHSNPFEPSFRPNQQESTKLSEIHT